MADEITKPITVTMQETGRITGLSQAMLYELLKAKKLRSTHVGRRRLVFYDSIEELLAENTHG